MGAQHHATGLCCSSYNVLGCRDQKHSLCFQGTHSLVEETNTIKLRLSQSHAMDALGKVNKAWELRMPELNLESIFTRAQEGSPSTEGAVCVTAQRGKRAGVFREEYIVWHERKAVMGVLEVVYNLDQKLMRGQVGDPSQGILFNKYLLNQREAYLGTTWVLYSNLTSQVTLDKSLTSSCSHNTNNSRQGEMGHSLNLSQDLLIY